MNTLPVAGTVGMGAAISEAKTVQLKKAHRLIEY